MFRGKVLLVYRPHSYTTYLAYRSGTQTSDSDADVFEMNMLRQVPQPPADLAADPVAPPAEFEMNMLRQVPQPPADLAADPVAPPAEPIPAAVAVAHDVPWDDLFPKKSVYRENIVKYVLPNLFELLNDPAHRLTSPRDIVNLALENCRRRGDEFWGKYQVYTRKRSVCDAILAHYLPTLQGYIARRRG